MSNTKVTPDQDFAHERGQQVSMDRPLSVAGARALAVLRIAFGFTFLWAFVDKLFGFGKATPAARSWLNGGDPTAGFLKGAEGPFGGFFHGLAGDFWVSPLFMLGLLGVGVALILGAGMRIATVSGALMYAFMYLASLPVVTNPFLDDHLIGVIVMIVLALTLAGETWGLGRWWKSISLVQDHPVLR